MSRHYQPDPNAQIAGKHAPFRTPDGIEHKSWNAARKHLTGLDLLATIAAAGPDPVSVRDAVMAEWHVSRRSAPEARSTGTPSASAPKDHSKVEG